MEFAQRFSKIMEEKNITKYRLSKDVGVHATTIKNWLDGKGEPRYSELKNIASALKIPVEKLMGPDETSPALAEASRWLSVEFDGCSDVKLKEFAVEIMSNLNRIFSKYREIQGHTELRPLDIQRREYETIELINYCQSVHKFSSNIGRLSDGMAAHIQQYVIDETLGDWKTQYKKPTDPPEDE